MWVGAYSGSDWESCCRAAVCHGGPWARRVGPLASGPGNVTRVNTARPCCQNRRVGSLTEPLSSESDLETLRLRVGVPGRQATAALGPEGFLLKGPVPRTVTRQRRSGAHSLSAACFTD